MDIPLINCEVSLTLTWSKDCAMYEMTTQDADPNINPPVSEIKAPTDATFKITNTKLYVLALTLSTEDDNKPLEQLKTRFKRTSKWNKYRSEMTIQANTNNLNYLIDPTFTKVNRLFVLSFEKDG